MTLHLHRATRTDRLADGLARVLAEPLADPFAEELVVVPAKGIERWLSQRLSHRLGATPMDAEGAGDGVCAGVRFGNPHALIAGLLGIDDDDPWGVDPLTWRVLAAIDAHLEEPWATPLAVHLGVRHGASADVAGPGSADELRLGRRYALARRVAGLFAAYAGQRPGVLRDWSAGVATDGAGGEVPGDLAWQPPLWRAVAALTEAPTPYERHAATVRRLADDPGSLALPERLSLFGHTRLPASDVELLAAVARERDVHLWLPHPSPALWEALSGVAPKGAQPRRRRDDRSHRAARHPLLAGLGRDLREFQATLQNALPQGDKAISLFDQEVPGSSAHPRDAQPAAIAAAPPAGRASLLARLQADLAANRPPGALADDWTHRQEDRSVQVHACHGPARQVEVLREVLVGLLADDPRLEPRDIVVMCPDIEAYAPLVQASFGLADVVGEAGHPAHQLRVKLADRALVQTNPLLTVAAALLELTDGRATASVVLELAAAEPVRRRFAFSDDDLAQLTAWVGDAGIRWAFDAEHRAAYSLAGFVQNTWRFGLDRILAGVALSDDAGGWLDKTLPLDDVGSGQIDLAGRFAEFVDRLQRVTDRLTGVRPLSDWQEALIDGLAALTAVSHADAWQPGQAQRELYTLGADRPEGVSLRLSDVRVLLRGRLAGRPTRANFRTGTLTVCSMVPMRSVPHRVICLLGLDDGVFPRVTTPDGDDLLAREPLVGERDLRAEDRQLMLDALTAATDTLVITYTGADVLSGQVRPPAVPLGELLDALAATAQAPVEELIIRHPLQPYDVRNLQPGRLVGDRAFSFDPAAAEGARAARRPRRTPPSLRRLHLSPERSDQVTLEELSAFFRSPVRAFLQQRLQVALPFEEDPVTDALPVEVDNLVEWAVGERVIDDLLGGLPPDQAAQREWRRGVLPPGRLGWRQLSEIVERAVPIAREAHRLRERTPRQCAIDLALDGDRRLTGTVGPVYGSRLVPVSYSRLNAGHRLRSWIQLLALSAQDPDHVYTAHTVGRRGGRYAEAEVSRLGPVDDHTALARMRDLVAIFDEGRAQPLPLPVKSSYAYAQYRRSQASPQEALRAARKRWRDDRFPGEQSDREQVQMWGPRADLPGARKDGWGELHNWGEPDEATPFGAYAVRMWRPLMDAENLPW